jgi:hypothetical protein
MSFQNLRFQTVDRMKIDAEHTLLITVLALIVVESKTVTNSLKSKFNIRDAFPNFEASISNCFTNTWLRSH